MKTNFTRKTIGLLSLLSVLLFAIAACKKNDSQTDASNQKVSKEMSVDDFVNDLVKIAKLGFDPYSTKIIPEGYLVEGDIVLTQKDLAESYAALSKQQGQYSSNYAVKLNAATKERTLKVYFSVPADFSKHQEAFDASITAMNDTKTCLKFASATKAANADIVVKFEDLGKKKATGVTLARSAGFVNYSGDPGNTITFNSHADAKWASASKERFTATLCHEYGHAIGIRHTDYKNRAYSAVTGKGQEPTQANYDSFHEKVAEKVVEEELGKDKWTSLSESRKKQYISSIKKAMNEGDGSSISDDYARHSYGTPISPTYGGAETTDPLSLMLAYSMPSIYVFSAYDHVLLFNLYGNEKQKALIKKSLGKYGDVVVAGKTLQQIVDEAKALGK